MSFSYNTFKDEMKLAYPISFITKKDMMAKTEAPPMRVAVIKITKRMNDDDSLPVIEHEAVPVAIN